MDQKSDKSKDPIENNEADMQMSSIQNESQKEESDNSETVKKDENLSQKVKDAYSKSEDFQDKYIRVMADIDNLKRRQIKEREDTVIRTRSQIISDLLPVLDAFQMGMNEVEKEESTKRRSTHWRLNPTQADPLETGPNPGRGTVDWTEPRPIY